METETTTLSEYITGEKAMAEQILAPEDRNKSTWAGLRESQTPVQKLTI